MKKTICVPKGRELKFKTLICENIVVNGSLRAENDIRAKRISGNGFISAKSVSADTISADDICAKTIVADTLAAKRISAKEIYATREVLASSYIRASRAVTGRLIVSRNAIGEIEADEVIVLSPKRRSILGALFASFVRSKFAALFAKRPRHEKTGAETEPAGRDRKAASPPKPEAKDIPAGNLAVSEDSKIIAAICGALKSGEYTLRITPRENSAETPESTPFTEAREAVHGRNAA